MIVLRLIALTLLLSVTVATRPAFAATEGFVPAPPDIKASGFILQDFQSGRVLAESKADERMEPASLTKMMTAYVVFQELRGGQLRLDDMVRVSEKAWRMPGSRMFIEVDSRVSVRELLKGLIVQSGNDASVALAESVAGSEDAFVPLMNAHAQKLGMSGSNFTNSTGLPGKEHYSTPRDMARLAAALVREFPEHYKWYSQKEYTFNNIKQHNRNLLLWRDESVDGIKTGHTQSAGYCLVSSAERNGMRLISVVMGAGSENARAQESQKLLDYGYRFYETHRLYAAHEPLKQLRIWKGEAEQVGLGLQNELYVTVPRGRYGALKAAMTVDKTIVAPTRKGDPLGRVEVRLGEQLLAEHPLVALEDVREGSLWRQVVDHFMLLVQ